MSKYNFYYEGKLEKESLFLSEQESTHCVKVLRLKEEQKINLFNGSGVRAKAKIIKIYSQKKVEVLISFVENLPQPKPKINLFLAPPQSSITSKLIKQLVELGVNQITFLNTDYCVAKIGNYNKLKNQMVEALKQSGNGFLPQLNPSCNLEQAFKGISGTYFYGAVPSENKVCKQPEKISSPINLFVGPEAGFSDKERVFLQEKALPITVGSHILRIETATIALIAKFL